MNGKESISNSSEDAGISSSSSNTNSINEQLLKDNEMLKKQVEKLFKMSHEYREAINKTKDNESDEDDEIEDEESKLNKDGKDEEDDDDSTLYDTGYSVLDYVLDDSIVNMDGFPVLDKQCLYDTDKCILAKDKIKALNRSYRFPDNYHVKVAPISAPIGIAMNDTIKKKDSDLYTLEYRINDVARPLLATLKVLVNSQDLVPKELFAVLENNLLVALKVQASAQATCFRIRKNNVIRDYVGQLGCKSINIDNKPVMFTPEETKELRSQAKEVLKNKEIKKKFSYSNNNKPWKVNGGSNGKFNGSGNGSSNNNNNNSGNNNNNSNSNSSNGNNNNNNNNGSNSGKYKGGNGAKNNGHFQPQQKK